MTPKQIQFITDNTDDVSASRLGEMFKQQFPDFDVLAFRIMMDQTHNNRYTFGLQLHDYLYLTQQKQ